MRTRTVDLLLFNLRRLKMCHSLLHGLPFDHWDSPLTAVNCEFCLTAVADNGDNGRLVAVRFVLGEFDAPIGVRSTSRCCQQLPRAKTDLTVTSCRPFITVSGFIREEIEALGFSFSAVFGGPIHQVDYLIHVHFKSNIGLTECCLLFLKVPVTPRTVHLPSLVPLDPFSPVSPSSHDPRLLLIVTRISSSLSDCSDILRCVPCLCYIPDF
ncbi:hypothetical protein GQ457_08G002940 [Hibiscus cannabinus]